MALNYGETPLCSAALLGDDETVAALLESGAEVNAARWDLGPSPEFRAS
jgi:ankyrin repeat protein